MSAPITHIVLANKVFNNYFSDKDKKLFLVGTSFPDIRRLGKIPREKVHYHNYSLKDLKQHDSFMAGLKFHSAVDLISTQYVLQEKVPDLFPDTIYTWDAIKLFADRVLKPEYSHWKLISEYFNQIYEEEKEFGVSEEAIKSWHKILSNYFTSDINHAETIGKLFTGNGASSEFVNGIFDISNKANDYKKAEKIFQKFYNQFDKYVEKYNLIPNL